MAIKEVGGKTMKAMVVFAYCIEHIKDKILNRLKQAIYGLDENDVHWVVTVPATWNEQARQVMIEASAKAGINKDSLTLALEPECTAMYCIYLAMNKQEHGDNMETKAFNENSGLIVVDLGSRTINISEVLPTGQLREIYNATGGPLDYDDYLEILRQVERVKRAVDYDSEFSVRIPKEILTNINVPDSLKQYVRVGRKCITLSTSLIQKIWSSPVDSMIKHVDELLKKDDACSVSTILLVGGYSASNVIQHAFREKFEKKYRVIIPITPDLLFLKGAVITGHCVEDIGGRMEKYHYGLGLSTAAVSGRIISIGDNEKKTFFLLIKKCHKIKVGEVVTQYEIVLKAKSRWTNLEMYTNKDDNPGIIIDNEHLKKVGSILVKLPQYKKESILILTISYDETECKVSATDKNTGRCFDAICRFLKRKSIKTRVEIRINTYVQRVKRMLFSPF
ncbi:unnamed protein product [Mytilus coruscus]|uniref:Uncharacterized protein n=1 Tax=Mytilus coruscus TaxID=42192 RepID=A0A6J8CWA3_MYTCO|nr:unnamed protein product [Mytilus coruscus]